MKKYEFYKNIEWLKNLCFKDGNEPDIVYLCSDETYDKELEFDFDINPVLDFDYCKTRVNDVNVYIIKSNNKEYKNMDKFIVSPKESKPIRVRFE